MASPTGSPNQQPISQNDLEELFRIGQQSFHGPALTVNYPINSVEMSINMQVAIQNANFNFGNTDLEAFSLQPFFAPPETNPMDLEDKCER